MFIVPVLYEKYERQVDSFAEKANAEFKKQYAVFDSKVLSKIPRGPLKDKKTAWVHVSTCFVYVWHVHLLLGFREGVNNVYICLADKLLSVSFSIRILSSSSGWNLEMYDSGVNLCGWSYLAWFTVFLHFVNVFQVGFIIFVRLNLQFMPLSMEILLTY